MASKADSVPLHGELAETLRLLDLVEQIAHVGHWRASVPDGTRSWSAETFRIFGLDPAHGIPDLREQFNGYHPDDRDRVRAYLKNAANIQSGSFEARIVRPGGEIRHVIIRGSREERDGVLHALFGVIIDVTDQMQVAAHISESEARYRVLAEHTTDMIVHADLDSTRLYVSPSSVALIGYLPRDLVGARAKDGIHPDDQIGFQKFLDTLGQGGSDRLITQQRYRHKDGHYVWAETTYSVLADPISGQPKGYVAASRDITERRAAEIMAVHAARHDPLTGLPNRTLFRERLEAALVQAQQNGTAFVLLWMDLDRFKSINDTFGHPAGDRMLCQIANRIRSVVRAKDTVARIGGDEFAILQTGAGSIRDTQILAQHIIDVVNDPFELDKHAVNIGASIGIAVWPTDGDNVAVLFKHVDLAMYRAKLAGRNRFCFYEPTMDVLAANRLAFEIDLRDAIAANELCLHYQPIVDIATGAITGFEALLRWQHPTRGVIPPNVFIPVAEESGLIVALGAWVLLEACSAAAAWPGALPVAVNVSVCQFRRPGFEDSVFNALAASGLPPAQLELEITESVLIEDTQTVCDCLMRLRALGVRTSLDDFGTGYSSLSYLQRFPFDKIKVDRSFVQSMGESVAAAVVNLVAELGARLGIVVIAEGVETEAHLEQVRAAGCHQYQGWLFSKAVPAAEARRLLEVTVEAVPA